MQSAYGSRPICAGGTIASSYGILIDSPTAVAGTVTDNYGLYQAEAAAKNYFAGNVGIGTTIPDNLLTVNGTADKPGGGSWGTFSDARLKDVERTFDYGLAELMQLQPIFYRYKQDNPLALPSTESYSGFIAQDVQKVIPEAVELGSMATTS